MISISKDIKLKEIKIEDQAKLMALVAKIYPPAYKHLWINEDCNFYLNNFYSLNNLKLELADPNALYYFVFYNSKLVGILRFIFNTVFEEKPNLKSTHLNRIYLAEDAQGKGVAHQLMEWMEKKVKAHGNSLIWLKAMDSQKQALRFYEKEGYHYGSPTQLDFKLLQPHLKGMNIMYKQLS